VGHSWRANPGYLSRVPKLPRPEKLAAVDLQGLFCRLDQQLELLAQCSFEPLSPESTPGCNNLNLSTVLGDSLVQRRISPQRPLVFAPRAGCILDPTGETFNFEWHRNLRKSSRPITRQQPMLFAADITNLECASATTAAQESCQQCGTTSHSAIRTPHACILAGVGADLLLITHKLFPRNIPFVVIRNGNFPLLQRASIAAVWPTAGRIGC
jgi:hypothetical protein